MPEATFVCCGNVNRGLAILGNMLFLGALDAHWAIDTAPGRKKPSLQGPLYVSLEIPQLGLIDTDRIKA